MFYLTELVEKEVFDGDTYCGSNAALYFDNVTRKCAIKIADRLYAIDKISVGKTVMANVSEIPRLHYGEPAVCPFGKIFVGQRVYDLNGKFLGEVEDAEFTPKFVLKKIWVKDAEFKRNEIYSVSDVLLIKAKTPKQLLRQQEKSTQTSKNKTAPAADSAHTTKQDTFQSVVEVPQTASAKQTALPQQPSAQTGQIRKRYGNFNFLLGKVVDKTIVNFQGEIMIKKSEKVTREVLRQAKISGKLIELYLHVE